jgi:hypothetical protein
MVDRQFAVSRGASGVSDCIDGWLSRCLEGHFRMTITDEPQSLKNQPLDKERLRQKYMEERNKRLRPDGNDQYLQVAGQLAHYLDDPYAPVTPREPKIDHVTFAFIGGGFAGLATAARLSETGIRDVCIIEKGGDFGGTWYWNRYPGAQCDTASMVYMPLLEETGYMPSENTRMRRKSWRTASVSASNMAFMTTRCSIPRS